MKKIFKFFKKLIGRPEPDDIKPEVEIYQADERLDNLEYNGTIEENVLKGIRDKPFRQRRMSSCAPNIKSIKELGNMEEMCEQLGEEPDAPVDKFSSSKKQEYKRRLSRRYSRKMSVSLSTSGMNLPVSAPLGSATPSLSSLHQSNLNLTENVGPSIQNLPNMYKVPSGLDARTLHSNSNNQMKNNVSNQRISTNSKISGITQLHSQTNSTMTLTKIGNNNNNSGGNSTSNNIARNSTLRKGSIFQNRRVSIVSVDCIAGAGLTGINFMPNQHNTQIHNNETHIRQSESTNQNHTNQNNTQQTTNPSKSARRSSNSSNTRGQHHRESQHKASQENTGKIVETSDEETTDDFHATQYSAKRRSSNASKVYQHLNTETYNHHVSGNIKMLEGENPFENQILN
jgi:hypothetical protein